MGNAEHVMPGHDKYVSGHKWEIEADEIIDGHEIKTDLLGGVKKQLFCGLQLTRENIVSVYFMYFVFI